MRAKERRGDTAGGAGASGMGGAKGIIKRSGLRSGGGMRGGDGSGSQTGDGLRTSRPGVIGFISFGNVAIFLSIAVIVIGVAAIYYFFGGLALGIDFKSGISMQVQIDGEENEALTAEDVRAALSGFGAIGVQRVTSSEGRYLIKSDLQEDGSDEAVGELQALLEAQFGADNIQILEIAFIGPRYSRSVARQSLVLTLSALALILVYIWIRFRLRYAISAIVALLHDVLMTVVFLGITRTELSTTTVAAVLTIIGYSLNDTVVIFDRIRENSDTSHGKQNQNLSQIANISIRQSMSRTIITSLTTLLAVVAIYVFSTEPIKDFALCMIFGVVVGTYSSICIASPVLVSLARRSARTLSFSQRRQNKRDAGAALAAPTAVGGGVIAIPSEKGAQARGGGKPQTTTTTIDTERIKQRLIAQRRQQQQKKKKK